MGVGLESDPDSESLLVIAAEADCWVGFLVNVMEESEGVRGREGQTMLPVLHSSGMLPLRHWREGKQLTISVDFWSISVGESKGLEGIVVVNVGCCCCR